VEVRGLRHPRTTLPLLEGHASNARPPNTQRSNQIDIAHAIGGALLQRERCRPGRYSRSHEIGGITAEQRHEHS